MKNTLLLLSTLTTVEAATWDYKKNGADWATASPDRGLEQQSPIDLRTDWDTEMAKDDKFNKVYTNQKGSVKVNWNGHTSQVDLTNVGQTLQSFSSNYVEDEFKGGDKFNGVQFHFHAGSEHTVDGVR